MNGMRDLRIALRALRRSPGMTAISIGALALGIGGVTCTLSSVVGLVLRPYPFPEMARLVSLERADLKRGGGSMVVSSADYLEWRDVSRSFEKLAAIASDGVDLGGGEAPERAEGRRVTPDFFSVLGATPALGRAFLSEEFAEGRDAVVVLGYGLWQRRFQGQSGVVGQTLLLDGKTHTIVGVMSREFEFPAGAEYWRPLAIGPQHREWTRGTSWLVVGRLRAGVSRDRAQTEMETIASRIARDHPAMHEGQGVRVVPLGELGNAETRRFVVVGFAGAAFVLLLACLNVSNLLLARATTRGQDVAVRMALGAGRLAIARLFAWEGLVLAAGGAVLGVGLGAWGLRLSRATAPAQVYQWVPGLRNLSVDGSVLAGTIALALVAGLGCGLFVAWRATRRDALAAGLTERGRGGSAAHSRLREALVVGEVAVALVLLVAAAIMARTYARMAVFDLGFEPTHVLQMTVRLPASRYPDAAAVRAYWRDVVTRLEATPGVQVAAAGHDGAGITEFRIEGQPPVPQGTRTPGLRLVSPQYFQALGIPVLRGRSFTREDEALDETRVAVVSESALRRYWRGDADPVGASIVIPDEGLGKLRLVGVVGDVKDWFSRRPNPTVYVLNTHIPQRHVELFARTAGDPGAVAGRARAEVQALDPTRPIEDVRSLAQDLANQASGVRISSVQMGVFALIALVLATTGIYGVVAFSVAQRTREIGVRMALGAQADGVLRLVVGESLRTSGLGLLLGLVGAVALTRLLASVLFDVVVVDAAMFVVVGVLLAACAAAAAYLPARRAAGVNPVEALRAE